MTDTTGSLARWVTAAAPDQQTANPRTSFVDRFFMIVIFEYSRWKQSSANVWDNRTNYRQGKQAYTRNESLQLQQTPVICSYSSLC